MTAYTHTYAWLSGSMNR